MRDAHRAAEVAAGAERDQREARVRRDGDAALEEPVDDLVDRAVAADRDDPLGSALQRLARELCRVPRPWVMRLVERERAPSVSASSVQRLPSFPPCDFGLTMTTVRGSTGASIEVRSDSPNPGGHPSA